MTKAEHRAYIDSPSWDRRRRQFLRANGRRCAACGTARGPIEVHHVTYDRAVDGRELDTDLRALCPPHHELAHGYEGSGAFGRWGAPGTLSAATSAMIEDVRGNRHRPAAGPLRRWLRRQWLVATGRRYSEAWDAARAPR